MDAVVIILSAWWQDCRDGRRETLNEAQLQAPFTPTQPLPRLAQDPHLLFLLLAFVPSVCREGLILTWVNS